MKKYIIEYIENIIKLNDEHLGNKSYTPLGEEIFNAKSKLLSEIKQSIESINECGVYTKLITCDFKEKTMTFELPKGLQLKSGEYYIEFNK